MGIIKIKLDKYKKIYLFPPGGNVTHPEILHDKIFLGQTQAKHKLPLVFILSELKIKVANGSRGALGN